MGIMENQMETTGLGFLVFSSFRAKNQAVCMGAATINLTRRS